MKKYTKVDTAIVEVDELKKDRERKTDKQRWIDFSNINSISRRG